MQLDFNVVSICKIYLQNHNFEAYGTEVLETKPITTDITQILDVI